MNSTIEVPLPSKALVPAEASLPVHGDVADDWSVGIERLAPRQDWSLPVCNAIPFAAELVESLDQLGQAIRHDGALRTDPSSMALGFWLRRASLFRLGAEFQTRQATDHRLIVPAGRVLQIAPQNVDTLFVYSWALGYLTGNASIVRVSTRPALLVTRLLDVLNRQMLTDSLLREANRFITYEHRDSISAALSQWCDQRIVWGGDATVAKLRSIPVRPAASERSFSTKFSGCVLKADFVLALGEAELASLAERFLVDVTTFDQQACSSPQVVYWWGTEPVQHAARARWVDAVDRAAQRRGWQPSPAQAMQRLQFACEAALDQPCRVDLSPHSLTHVVLEATAVVSREACGGGLLQHYGVGALSEIAARIEPDDQTLTHAGLSFDEVRELGHAAGRRGLDRLVPVGQALDFDALWDGYDLLADCTRLVTVRM